MGVKGAKKSPKADAEQAAVVALPAPLGEFSSRSQFGGHGIFVNGTMFALVTSDGVLHLEVDDTNREDFEPDSRFGKMPYHRVPSRVRDDTRALRRWARKAIAVAQGQT